MHQQSQTTTPTHQDVNGRKKHFQVIILHGWGHNKGMWQSVLSKLSNLLDNKFTLDAWDLPGFGKEKLVSADWNIPDYTKWVESKISSKIESKNKPAVILIGHSFGGRIAAHLASQRPAWLHKLILVGTPALRRPSWQVKWRIRIYKLFKHIVPKRIRQRFYAQELKEARSQNLGKIFYNAVNFDQTEHLPNIQVPTLLLWGEHDQAAPLTIATEMHQLIPSSELVVIKQAGHNLHLENTNILSGKISSFINSGNNK